MPSVKYLSKAYYSGFPLYALNSYHSQCDNLCNVNFVKYTTGIFSFYLLFLYFCVCQEGHEKMGYWIKRQITAVSFFFHLHNSSLEVYRSNSISDLKFCGVGSSTFSET